MHANTYPREVAFDLALAEKQSASVREFADTGHTIREVATHAARKYGWGYILRKDSISHSELVALLAEGFAVETSPELVRLTDAGIRAALED